MMMKSGAISQNWFLAILPQPCVMSLLLFVLLFAEGCLRVQQVAPGSHEADIKALREAEIAEEQAWSSKDIEKALSFNADSITYMSPNMPVIIGKENLRAYMKPVVADPAFTCQYQIANVDVSQSGDLGFTQGTYTCTMTDPKSGKLTSDRGKWLTVRKKQPEGSWKIVQDIFNSDLPLPSASK
jgi:ketosteroid isomerase-like protein